MSRARIIRYLDGAILVLLCIFFVCEHHVKFTAIKNISLYSSLLFAIILCFIDKANRIKNIKNNFLSAKKTLIFLSIFIVYAFIISYFAYTDEFESLKDAFKEFGRGVVFLFIILVFANGKYKKVNAIFYSILLAFVFISVYYLLPVFENFKNIDANTELARLVNRAYAPFADRFAAFAFLSFFIIKNRIFKNFVAIFCVVFVAMDILTGARGSWLAIFVSFLLSFFVLFLASFRQYLISNLKYIACFGIIAALTLGLLVANSSIFENKFSQGIYSSGRDLILKERLPLLFDSQRAFWGIGHGFRVYDKFLEDKSNEKNITISMMSITKTGRKHWFNDEPFFIGNYYYYGFIGTFGLTMAYLSLLFSSFSELMRTKDLLFAAIFISLISYFGVRGLFETMNLKILYLFYMAGFFILVKSCYRGQDER